MIIGFSPTNNNNNWTLYCTRIVHGLKKRTDYKWKNTRSLTINMQVNQTYHIYKQDMASPYKKGVETNTTLAVVSGYKVRFKLSVLS